MLASVSGLDNKSTITDFLGGKIKSVQGLGDRSAYGLPDENGVIVMNAGINTLLSKSGLQNKDVIRMVDGKIIKTVKDLVDMYQSSIWKNKLEIQFIRNQQLQKTFLLLK